MTVNEKIEKKQKTKKTKTNQKLPTKKDESSGKNISRIRTETHLKSLIKLSKSIDSQLGTKQRQFLERTLKAILNNINN